MIRDIIFQKTSTSAILKSLDAAMLRSKAIANNIANVTTPGYRRVEVKFEDNLKRALDKVRLRGKVTDSKHIRIGRKDISNIKIEAYKPSDPSMYSGVNNVNIDMEMAKLAENQLMFSMGVKFLKGSYSKLNAAVKGKSLNV